MLPSGATQSVGVGASRLPGCTLIIRAGGPAGYPSIDSLKADHSPSLDRSAAGAASTLGQIRVHIHQADPRKREITKQAVPATAQ